MIRTDFLRENAGLYTKGAKDKAQAVKSMREIAQKEYDIDPILWEKSYHFKPEDITEETVKDTRYYQCRRCDVETIGDDNICFDCGEPVGTTGRRTFAFIVE